MFVWSIYTWLYNKNIKVYIFVNRILKRRKEVFLNINATYICDDTIDFYDKFEEIVFELYERTNVRKEMNLTNHKIYNLPDYLVKIQSDTLINATSGKQEIFLEIPKLRTTLGTAERLLEKIEQLDTDIQSQSMIESRNYNLEIVFEKTADNPFVYQITKIFGPDAIKSFNCKLDCALLSDEISNKIITVKDKKILVNEQKFRDIKKMIPYLLLIKS